jgi:diphosphomevalonate decarboxylase
MKSTVIACSNIAFVKYWGKLDKSKNIAMNSSISMTLDENLSTKTTVEFSKEFKEDILILNNEKYSDNKLLRVSNFLDIIRQKAKVDLFAKVISINSFPTGTGIASSASGFSALAAASTKALGLTLTNEELADYARLGSGSASRSIFGGFVLWDSEHCHQIKDEKHWDKLRDIIVIVSSVEKKISSRAGMKKTVDTSTKYKQRLTKVGKTIEVVQNAIIKKDFETLAINIMKDSDNMHECMFDTEPSLVYLNDTSNKIKEVVNKLNKNKIIAAYSFDAGPNAHIITRQENVELITRELLKIFGVQVVVSKPGQGIKYSDDHLF